jgi:hypothetical protein
MPQTSAASPSPVSSAGQVQRAATSRAAKVMPLLSQTRVVSVPAWAMDRDRLAATNQKAATSAAFVTCCMGAPPVRSCRGAA